jgi:hypothetical protein
MLTVQVVRVEALVRDFRRAWATACKAAGCPGCSSTICGARRCGGSSTGGQPERVAMSLTGHKTLAVLDRYHIVSRTDQRAVVDRGSR